MLEISPSVISIPLLFTYFLHSYIVIMVTTPLS